MTATVTSLAAARAARGLPPVLPLLPRHAPRCGDRVRVLPPGLTYATCSRDDGVSGLVEGILPAPPGAPEDATVYHVRTAHGRLVAAALRVAWPWERRVG